MGCLTIRTVRALGLTLIRGALCARLGSILTGIVTVLLLRFLITTFPDVWLLTSRIELFVGFVVQGT